MYSYPNKAQNQNNKNKDFKNGLKSYKIEIEYEKISPKLDSQLNPQDENENFNVYFMKPDFKYKTISTSNSLTNSRIKKLNQNKVDKNKEKEFKSHLIQKLKSLKLNQSNKDKIPLNIASKIRREESIRNSLKYLLAKQAQYDPKKELMYYKAYFRFWKRKCKNDKYNGKKIIKKDKNIRITTVIYRADKPNKYLSNNIIEESKNENSIKKRNNFFRNKLIRIMESKSKDKIKIKKQDKEDNESNYKEKNLNKENKKNLINNINTNSKVSNNIKTIKNITNINNEENNVINEIETKINNNYNTNKKYELTKSRKEALNKINNNIKKEFKVEGFNKLKKFRDKSREKEGTELLNDIFSKKNKKYKEEAINKIKKNVNNTGISNNFDIEGEKWTVNKFNWQVEELNKDNDSLYGLSDEELKESNNQNNIIMNEIENIDNNKNINNNSENQIQPKSKNKEITSRPLEDQNNEEEEQQEEEEYEIIPKDENENLENEENNDFNGEEYINYEEIENNNFENNEEDNGEEQEQYNYEEGNHGEEYYEEENLGEEYIDENEMEEMVEEENSQRDGLDYLKDEVEEIDNEEEGNENNENL